MPFFINCREAAIASVIYKKVFWKISQNSQESTCARTSVVAKLQADVIKKEILAQVFPYEFCDIFKNTFNTSRINCRKTHRKTCMVKCNFSKVTNCIPKAHCPAAKEMFAILALSFLSASVTVFISCKL